MWGENFCGRLGNRSLEVAVSLLIAIIMPVAGRLSAGTCPGELVVDQARRRQAGFRRRSNSRPVRDAQAPLHRACRSRSAARRGRCGSLHGGGRGRADDNGAGPDSRGRYPSTITVSRPARSGPRSPSALGRQPAAAWRRSPRVVLVDDLPTPCRSGLTQDHIA